MDSAVSPMTVGWLVVAACVAPAAIGGAVLAWRSLAKGPGGTAGPPGTGEGSLGDDPLEDQPGAARIEGQDDVGGGR